MKKFMMVFVFMIPALAMTSNAQAVDCEGLVSPHNPLQLEFKQMLNEDKALIAIDAIYRFLELRKNHPNYGLNSGFSEKGKTPVLRSSRQVSYAYAYDPEVKNKREALKERLLFLNISINNESGDDEGGKQYGGFFIFDKTKILDLRITRSFDSSLTTLLVVAEDVDALTGLKTMMTLRLSNNADGRVTLAIDNERAIPLVRNFNWMQSRSAYIRLETLRHWPYWNELEYAGLVEYGQ
ncbi:MAG: hypothetical protein AABZ31_09820 [Bdellovibrionota bacterium]